jgi:two-component system response regulator YesN
MLNDRLVQDGEKILYFKSIILENSMYYYPIDLELRLISTIKFGELDQVRQIMDSIHDENFKKRRLSFEMGMQLIFSLRGTIYRVFDQADVQDLIRDKIERLDKVKTIERMFSCLVNITMSICNQIKTNQKKETGNFKFNLIRYIETCYMRQELNLYQVAMHFGVTENYIYQFFKEFIGVSFAEYLENIRIQKACNLLSNTDIAVKKVAQMVGYSSDSSFRRAFKRLLGIAPTQYSIVINSSI